MLKSKHHIGWLDFHPGGAPAGIIFDGQIKDACELANVCPSGKEDFRQEVGAEFALIGLIAYFEGFCKNHTATVINICPHLVRRLADRGREIRLRPVDIFDCWENISTQFGCLVVEKIDFGTAKSINALYKDLLLITPFSKREANRFHDLLEDRHLIVHHGNIFAPNYSNERFIRREMGRSRIFLDSLNVTSADVQKAAQLLHQLSVKLRNESQRALAAYVKSSRLRLAKPNREAIEMLGAIAPGDS